MADDPFWIPFLSDTPTVKLPARGKRGGARYRPGEIPAWLNTPGPRPIPPRRAPRTRPLGVKPRDWAPLAGTGKRANARRQAAKVAAARPKRAVAPTREMPAWVMRGARARDRRTQELPIHMLPAETRARIPRTPAHHPAQGGAGPGEHDIRSVKTRPLYTPGSAPWREMLSREDTQVPGPRFTPAPARPPSFWERLFGLEAARRARQPGARIRSVPELFAEHHPEAIPWEWLTPAQRRARRREQYQDRPTLAGNRTRLLEWPQAPQRPAPRASRTPLRDRERAAAPAPVITTPSAPAIPQVGPQGQRLSDRARAALGDPFGHRPHLWDNIDRVLGDLRGERTGERTQILPRRPPTPPIGERETQVLTQPLPTQPLPTIPLPIWDYPTSGQRPLREQARKVYEHMSAWTTAVLPRPAPITEPITQRMAPPTTPLWGGQPGPQWFHSNPSNPTGPTVPMRGRNGQPIPPLAPPILGGGGQANNPPTYSTPNPFWQFGTPPPLVPPFGPQQGQQGQQGGQRARRGQQGQGGQQGQQGRQRGAPFGGRQGQQGQQVNPRQQFARRANNVARALGAIYIPASHVRTWIDGLVEWLSQASTPGGLLLPMTALMLFTSAVAPVGPKGETRFALMYKALWGRVLVPETPADQAAIALEETVQAVRDNPVIEGAAGALGGVGLAQPFLLPLEEVWLATVGHITP